MSVFREKNSKLQVFVLMLFLFSTLGTICVFAANNESFNTLDELTIETIITVPIEIIKKAPDSSIQYLKLNYSWIPDTDYRQKFIVYESTPVGNMHDNVLQIEKNNMQNFDLIVKLQTQTSAMPLIVSTKVNFPLKGLDSSVLKYTLPAGKADTNEDIKQKASELATGEDDLYVVVFKLADWVNSNIEYNLSSANVDASLPSSWVLENKQGVCDEISNLFISMCRSLGIPARFVSGISYTEDERFENPWGPHGWAEVYFPGYGWVPFDPTYNQLGYVDATHIKFNTKNEENKDALEYVWLGKDITVESKAIQIEGNVLKKGKVVEDDFSIDIEFFKNEVSIGYYNVIKATIRNNKDHYVAADIALSRVEGLQILSEERKDVLLEPQGMQTIYWIVKVEDLDKNFIYTFPITVYSSNEEESSQFTSTFASQKVSLKTAQNFVFSHEISVTGPAIECFTNKQTVYQNEKLEIICSSEKEKYFELCIEENCSFETFSTTKREFVANEIGFTTIKVSAKDLIAKTESSQAFLSFNVLDAAKVNMNVTYPDNLMFEDKGEIKIALSKESSSIPKNITLKINNKLLTQSWNIESLEQRKQFILEFYGKNLKSRQNSINISLEYYDDLGKKYVEEKIIFIDLQGLTFIEKIQVWLNNLFI